MEFINDTKKYRNDNNINEIKKQVIETNIIS